MHPIDFTSFVNNAILLDKEKKVMPSFDENGKIKNEDRKA